MWCASFESMMTLLINVLVSGLLSPYGKVGTVCTHHTPPQGCVPGGVGHGPRDQFCPIKSLQMAD